jgi:hypothetical protein
MTMGKEKDTNLMPPMPPPNLNITIMTITCDNPMLYTAKLRLPARRCAAVGHTWSLKKKNSIHKLKSCSCNFCDEFSIALSWVRKFLTRL